MVLGKPSRMNPWFWHGLECSLSLKNLMTWGSSILPVSWFLDCSISFRSSWASCAFPSSSSWSSESARLDRVCCQSINQCYNWVSWTLIDQQFFPTSILFGKSKTTKYIFCRYCDATKCCSKKIMFSLIYCSYQFFNSFLNDIFDLDVV